MRQLIPLGIIAIILALLLQFCQKPLVTSDVTMLEDKTDTFLVKPSVEDILPLYGLKENQYRGGNFRYMAISDFHYNVITEAHLSPVRELESSQLTRPKDVGLFEENVGKALNAGDREIGKGHSSIYVPLAKELNLLSRSKADRRMLILYSDLMENSDNLSFYDKKAMHLLESEPEKIQSLLEKEVTLENLSGIEVMIIFRPKTYEAGNAFVTVSSFYKRLLESQGAKVYIGANVVSQNQEK